MNKKYKVMNQKPEASDEEIQSYMNFQGLMNKRAEMLSSSSRSSLIKKFIGGAIILAVAVSVIWFFQKPETANDEQLSKNEPAAVQALALSEPTTDSTVTGQSPVRPDETVQPKQQSRKLTPEKKSTPASEPEKKTTAEESYVQAEPVNGYPDLYEYFSKNLIYPRDALKDSIQGVLTIAFIVNRSGRPEKIEIVNSLGESFDKEARRLVENMPEWKPAVLNGKPVPSRISLPVTFQIVRSKAR